MPDSKPVQYRIVDRSTKDGADERERVIAALLATPAVIAPKFFYDDLGCALYGAICRLPEYYPTRTEVALFREHRSDIGEAVGRGRQFVDLGAGDCCKGQAWLPFLAPRRYIAVDIARSELERSLGRMAPDFPEMRSFLKFWQERLDGPLHSVRYVHRKLISATEWRALKGELILH